MDAAKLITVVDSARPQDHRILLEGKAAVATPAVGLLALMAWVGLSRPVWTDVLLGLSVAVVTGLGLRLADHPKNGPVSAAITNLRLLYPPAAALGLFAISLGSGFFATILSLPWFVFTATAGAVGILRAASRRSISEPAMAIDVGLVLFAIGGFWMLFSRTGFSPFGLSDETVALVAIQFQLVGFAAPILSGISARRLQKTLIVPIASIVLVPLVALSVLVGGVLGVVGLAFMAALGIALAADLIELSGIESSLNSRALQLSVLAMFGLALVVPAHVLLERFDRLTPTFELAIEAVGLLGAAGLAVLSLAALNLAKEPPAGFVAESRLHVLFSEDQLVSLQQRADTQASPRLEGLLESADLPLGYRRDSWTLQVDNFENSCDALWGWSGHEAAGIALSPVRPRIVEGETFAMAIPVGHLTATATARVIGHVDQPDCYGFSFACLEQHLWSGEESIMITRENGEVRATITAVWKPKVVAMTMFPAIGRKIQAGVMEARLNGIGDADVATISEYMSHVVQDVDLAAVTVSREELLVASSSERLMALASLQANAHSEEPPPENDFDIVYEQPTGVAPSSASPVGPEPAPVDVAGVPFALRTPAPEAADAPDAPVESLTASLPDAPSTGGEVATESETDDIFAGLAFKSTDEIEQDRVERDRRASTGDLPDMSSILAEVESLAMPDLGLVAPEVESQLGAADLDPGELPNFGSLGLSLDFELGLMKTSDSSDSSD